MPPASLLTVPLTGPQRPTLPIGQTGNSSMPPVSNACILWCDDVDFLVRRHLPISDIFILVFKRTEIF